MDLNNRLECLKNAPGPAPREEVVRKIIQYATEDWFRQEENQLMCYWEFLWTQLQYTRKRWWGMQSVLLLFACLIIPTFENNFYRVRSVGVIGCLFVVFIIPELWRNRECNAIQVEASCLYSLRQVYSARITLFGLVDLVLLTLFCLILVEFDFTLLEVVSQFLLPATVTACICFFLLCGKQNWGESVSLTVCLSWCGAWWVILLNEQLYTRTAPGIWAALFVTAVAFLVLGVRKTVRTTNQYWEVDFA